MQAADLFCGAGGTSMGLANACRAAGREVRLVAINHWDIAVKTHEYNHPWAEHLCEEASRVIPGDIFPGGRLDLLVASPECIHHSIARGGKPREEQSRATAWEVARWASAIHVEDILLENVKEFEDWGPLGEDGKMIPEHKGEIFQAFIGALRALGYTVDWRRLKACDYGAATSRLRFFLQARRNKPICWPEKTHFPPSDEEHETHWRTARDVIDWEVKGSSIFNRKKPLSENTMRRIEKGLEKFGGEAAEPFLIVLRGGGSKDQAQSVDRPVPTVTAGGNHICLVELFLVQYHGGIDGDQRVYSVDEPLKTVDTSNRYCLAEPFVVPIDNGSTVDGTRSVDEPLPTIVTKDRFAICEPFLLPHRHGGAWEGGSDPRSLDKPLPTITANSSDMALVEPFLVQVNHGGGPGWRSISVDKPIPALTTKNGLALVQPFITIMKGQSDVRGIDEPLPTITTQRHLGIVESFLVKYYGTGIAKSVDVPLDTVTTKGRFGLVEQYGVEILFRMLQPYELSQAMGFPRKFRFAGTKGEKTKQIGNAVSVEQAEALCTAMIG